MAPTVARYTGELAYPLLNNGLLILSELSLIKLLEQVVGPEPEVGAADEPARTLSTTPFCSGDAALPSTLNLLVAIVEELNKVYHALRGRHLHRGHAPSLRGNSYCYPLARY